MCHGDEGVGVEDGVVLHDAYGDGFVGGCCGGADGVAEKGAKIDWVGLGGAGGSG